MLMLVTGGRALTSRCKIGISTKVLSASFETPREFSTKQCVKERVDEEEVSSVPLFVQCFDGRVLGGKRRTHGFFGHMVARQVQERGATGSNGPSGYHDDRHAGCQDDYG